MKEVISVYPAPSPVDIGGVTDHDLPVYEAVNIFKVKNALITPYGYVISQFRLLKDSISFRHREALGLKNVISFSFFKKKIPLNTTAISITNGWYGGYYHFVLECLPKLFVVREFISSATVIFPKEMQAFHKQWLELLGVKNLLLLGSNEVASVPLAITSNFPARDLNHHNIIMPEFSRWVLSHLTELHSFSHKRIFIGRKDPRHRILINEQEIRERLNKYGFVYVQMEDLCVADQIKLFHNAKEIVCVHGAALSNICFSAPGTKVIDLMHEDFKQWCFLKLAKILQLDYHIIPCKGKGEHPLPGYKDIIADITLLEEKIKSWK